MAALDTKILRDLWRMRAQLVAIAAVVAAGAGLFLGMRTTMRSLQQAQAEYYARERFADVFASCKRAPEHLARRLSEIPGVQSIQTRVVADVTLDVPGLLVAATGRLVSLPDQGRPQVNDLRLRRGRLPSRRSANEVVASEAFMSAHGFRLGTSVGAVINGHWRTLEIVGVALAPEFTYSLAPGAVFPDDRRFGVFWLRRSALASSVAMRGAFNDVVLRVARDASVDSVIQRVDALLERYGGRGAIPRADQQSHIFVENEFAQIRAQSIMLPGLFLFVAATLLQVVTRRRCVQCPVVTGPAPACGLGRLASMARFSAPDKSGAAAKVATASGVFAPVIL